MAFGTISHINFAKIDGMYNLTTVMSRSLENLGRQVEDLRSQLKHVHLRRQGAVFNDDHEYLFVKSERAFSDARQGIFLCENVEGT